MKNLANKLKHHRCYLVVISLLLLSYSMYLYMHDYYLVQLQEELQKEQKKTLVEYEQRKKEESKLRSLELLALFESVENGVKLQVENELKSEVNLAYEIAHKTYEKYKKKKSKAEIKEQIKEALLQLRVRNKEGHIFIHDYKGNVYLDAGEDTENKEYRDIDLEMLNKVRRDKEGFIEYSNLNNERKILYIKELGFYKYFIGMTLNLETQKELEKAKLMKLLRKIPLNIGEEVL